MAFWIEAWANLTVNKIIVTTRQRYGLGPSNGRLPDPLPAPLRNHQTGNLEEPARTRRQTQKSTLLPIKRKQIDLEIAQWTVPFQSAPPLADNYYQTLRQLEEQERAHRSIMQEEIKLKMAEDMAHQQRMEQLKLERDHL